MMDPATAPVDLSIMIDKVLTDGTDGLWNLLDVIEEDVDLEAIREALHASRNAVHRSFVPKGRSGVLDAIDGILAGLLGAPRWTPPPAPPAPPPQPRVRRIVTPSLTREKVKRISRKPIPDEVKDAIVREYCPEVVTYDDLAEKYGVSSTSVHRIVTTWKR